MAGRQLQGRETESYSNGQRLLERNNTHPGNQGYNLSKCISQACVSNQDVKEKTLPTGCQGWDGNLCDLQSRVRAGQHFYTFPGLGSDHDSSDAKALESIKIQGVLF